MSMTEVILHALREYVPDDDTNPFASWAGECGIFVDVACQIADERGIKYEIGNAYNGTFDGGFDLTPPPGMTMDEVRSFDILKNLNHIWLIHEGRHFDGATPNGAESIFDLRAGPPSGGRADSPQLARAHGNLERGLRLLARERGYF